MRNSAKHPGCVSSDRCGQCGEVKSDDGFDVTADVGSSPVGRETPFRARPRSK